MLSFRRVLWPLPMLVGCVAGDDVIGGHVPCELIVEAPIVTLDTSAVGVEKPFTVHVTASDEADCEIASVNVANLDGTYFSERSGADGEVFPLTIPNGESSEIPLTWLPLTEGFHRAQITLALPDARDKHLSFEVRGHAALPDYAIFPDVIDFGSVNTVETATSTVEVENDGDLDLVIDRFNFTSDDGPRTTVELSSEAFPITVAAHSGRTQIPVRYHPASVRVMSATLSVMVAGEVAKSIRLLANDCEHGLAIDYDKDADGHASCGDDCDDRDAVVHPGAFELLDGKDNDCDGVVDEGTSGYDDDGDGYCDAGHTCSGLGVLPGDCQDSDVLVNPGMQEVCPGASLLCSDGIDNDCDGVIDDGADDPDSDGYTAAGGDCDEVRGTVHPGAAELPDGIDNDCDHVIDEGTANYDDDGDGFSEIAGDCDETNDPHSAFPGAAIYPGHAEVPNHRDDDCDGETDEGTYLGDDDGDGYVEGDPLDPTIDDRYRDCDDTMAARSPANVEVPGDPRGLDEDCDPATGP